MRAWTTWKSSNPSAASPVSGSRRHPSWTRATSISSISVCAAKRRITSRSSSLLTRSRFSTGSNGASSTAPIPMRRCTIPPIGTIAFWMPMPSACWRAIGRAIRITIRCTASGNGALPESRCSTALRYADVCPRRRHPQKRVCSATPMTERASPTGRSARERAYCSSGRRPRRASPMSSAVTQPERLGLLCGAGAG